ncbi:hypothetical protein N8865_02400 [Francisellaceae bacterium]|nr:hypothetical protein [Francisellaceae bacterium]
MKKLITSLSLSLCLIGSGISNPLCYNVGVNYTPQSQGTNTQLDQIKNKFSMIHLYHYDLATLQYARAHGLQVMLGTTNANAASFANKAAAEAFAKKIIPFIQSETIKVILLGNEPLNSSRFNQADKITQAITNVYSSLGENTVPVTININDNTYWGGSLDPRLHTVLPAIESQSLPWLFIDLYPFISKGVTIATAKTTFINQINGWKTVLSTKYPHIKIGVAQTGWASAGGPTKTGQVTSLSNENQYLEDIVSASQSQHIPVFISTAFDHPNTAQNSWDGHFGIFKNGIEIPNGLNTSNFYFCPII